MSNLTVAVFFTRNTSVPATGLALADIDLYLVAQNRVSGVDTVLWNGTQNPTEEIDDIGCYTRIYTLADMDTYNYFARGSYTGAVVLDLNHVTGGVGGISPWDFPTGVASLVAAIWSYARRTLTSVFTSLKSPIQGDQISILRGDTLDFDVVRLGDVSTRTNIWFSVKDDKDDADTAADIQIDEVTGLLYIMGRAGTAGNGSITVTDAVTGNLTVYLEAVETAKLSDKGRFSWDIQWLSAAGVVQTLVKGKASIVGDVTRAVA